MSTYSRFETVARENSEWPIGGSLNRGFTVINLEGLQLEH